MMSLALTGSLFPFRVAVALAVGFAFGSLTVTGEPGPAPATEYFPAVVFTQGFCVSPPLISREIPLTDFGRLAPMVPGTWEPFWALIHWYGVESLTDAHRTVFGEREAAWRNAYQGLRVALGDDGRPEVTMTLDSLAVYNHEPITYERMCVIRPHFLLSHAFYPDRDGVRRYGGAEEPRTEPDASVFPDLDTFAELTLSLKLRLAEATDLRREYRHDDPAKRRPHHNRAAFQFWLRVHCRTPGAPSHGRFFWVGYRAYDSALPYESPIPYRHDQIESDGRSTFAYRLSIGTVYGEDYEAPLNAFLAGRESALTIDVLKEVRKAVFAIRQEKQAFPDLYPAARGLPGSQPAAGDGSARTPGRSGAGGSRQPRSGRG